MLIVSLLHYKQAEDTQAGVSIVRSPIQIDDSSNSSNDLLDISDYTPAAKKEKTDNTKQTKGNRFETLYVYV